MYGSPAISLNSGLKVMYSNGCGSVDVTSVVSSVVVVAIEREENEEMEIK
jgi:hypothetical protein